MTLYANIQYYILIGKLKSKDKYRPILVDIVASKTYMAITTDSVGTVFSDYKVACNSRDILLKRGWKDIAVCSWKILKNE